jgi:hypothetical protein
MDEHIKNILAYKNLIDTDEKNDFFLFPFMALVLNLTIENGFVTADGLNMLHHNILDDFKIINEDPKNPSQKAVCRLTLYYTLLYNLIIYYCGFVCGLETEDGKKYADLLPADLIEYLKKIYNRVENYNAIVEHQLKTLQPLLTEKYAKVFNAVKRRHWYKNIFDDGVVHIPTHPDDLPEGFKPENCVNVTK